MLPEYVKFYYDNLPDNKKDVYMQLYKGFREHKKEFFIITDNAVIDSDDLMYIFRCLYNDTPSFYFVDPSSFRYSKTPNGYFFKSRFIYTEEKIKSYDRDITGGLEKFKQRYIKEDMTDYEKEITIHDYLVRTITYDEEALKNKDSNKTRHAEIFNVLGALLKKKAVCWGIACAFKLLCDCCRVKCFVVLGSSQPVLENSPGHAWNIVRLDGENYHVDVTWDIKEKGDISFTYDNFNLDDNMIRFDHTWDDKIYPPCTSVTYNYYHRNRLYVKTLECIPGYVQKKISSGEQYITFKFANTMPQEEEIQEKVMQGFLQAGYMHSYRCLVNPVNHNVYIELRPDTV